MRAISSPKAPFARLGRLSGALGSVFLPAGCRHCDHLLIDVRRIPIAAIAWRHFSLCLQAVAICAASQAHSIRSFRKRYRCAPIDADSTVLYFNWFAAMASMRASWLAPSCCWNTSASSHWEAGLRIGWPKWCGSRVSACPPMWSSLFPCTASALANAVSARWTCSAGLSHSVSGFSIGPSCWCVPVHVRRSIFLATTSGGRPYVAHLL